MVSMSGQIPDDGTRELPRILCLHGGGTNASIFRAQCRVIHRALSDSFRLVYAEAPYASDAGPDVLTVYADSGPFKRWLRWLPQHDPLDDAVAIADIDAALDQAMAADDADGATGPWVGLLGFSQGAKMAASLLFRQQVRSEKLGASNAGSNWRFAVLMAGRSPLVSLDPDVFKSPLLSDPGQIGLRAAPDLMEVIKGAHILKLPTIHVHGLADPGLELHRELLRDYCDSSARLIEWQGPHRIPFKITDVQPIVDAIVQIAKETGASQQTS